MVGHSSELITHLVVDSAPFLKRTHLETIGSHIYTTADVINELRDKRIRETLKCLPYVLRLEIPSKDSIKFVTDMAKKTGDFSVLSTTDLGLIALTYELHRTHIGDPVSKPVVPIPYTLGQQARMAVTAKKPPVSTPACRASSTECENVQDTVHYAGDTQQQQQQQDKQQKFETAAGNEAVDASEGLSDTDSDDSTLPSDDDWITEANFDQKALENFGLSCDKSQASAVTGADGEISTPIVACLTTDFAMQNVLFHLGLHLIGLNGMVITQPRTHLLWCGSCYRPTKRTDTYFCPSCAQANLRRIPVTLQENGELKFHFSRNFVSWKRGLKQPIRKPRGGKYADEPIYCPDQPLPDRRPAKPKHPNVQPIATNGMLDELADEFDGLGDLGGLAADTIAFPLHDVNSRSARIGVRSDHQVPGRSWHRPKAEHGLKPTRGTAHLPRPRTGNKKKKRRV